MMSSSNVVRWGALASILAGVLLLVQTILDKLDLTANHVSPYQVYNLPLFVVERLLFGTGLLLCAVGLMGLHARQAAHARLLGRIGLVLAYITAAAAVVTMVVNIIFPGDTDQGFFTLLAALLLLHVSLIPMSIATLIAGVLPRWSRALPLVILVLGLLFLFVNPDAGPVYDDVKGWIRFVCMILFSLGWVVLGYALLSERITIPVQARPVEGQAQG